MQLDGDSQELEGCRDCVSQGISVPPGSTTVTVGIMSLRGKSDGASST